MPTFEITTPDGRTFEVTGPEGSTKEQALERAKAQAGSAPATPKVPAGDLPVLGQAVREVNEKQSFGWATPLITSVVPETYPELAAMLGLTLLGGPLGVAGGAALKAAPKVGSALARVASAAVPAAVTGAAVGDNAAGVKAGAVQSGIEAAVPVARSLPGVSQWLSRRAANVDAGKLVEEIRALVPSWAPLMEGKKSAQALFDALVSPHGERALYGTYTTARNAVFDEAARAGQTISSPALTAYAQLKASTPGVTSRIQQAAEALRGTSSVRGSANDARLLFDELEKDALAAAKRTKSDPRAFDIIELANNARREIAQSVQGAGDTMLAAWEERGLGGNLMQFFNKAKAIVGGPRYDPEAATAALATKKGGAPLASPALEDVARAVDRGNPGQVVKTQSVAIPVGKGITIPTGISPANAGYDPGVLGRVAESLAQPAVGRITEEP